jgi:hypothetical protein
VIQMMTLKLGQVPSDVVEFCLMPTQTRPLAVRPIYQCQDAFVPLQRNASPYLANQTISSRQHRLQALFLARNNIEPQLHYPCFSNPISRRSAALHSCSISLAQPLVPLLETPLAHPLQGLWKNTRPEHRTLCGPQ